MAYTNTNLEIRALRDTLATATGAGRIGPLIELARVYHDRYQESMRTGRSGTDEDLDNAIASLDGAYELLASRDPWRIKVVFNLASLLAIRRLTSRNASVIDRDRAIDLFEDALEDPDLSPNDIEASHYYAAILRTARALPDVDMTSGSVTISSAQIERMLPDDRGVGADVTAALAHLRALRDGEHIVAEFQRVVPGLLGALNQIAALCGFAGAGDDGAPGVFQAVRW
jgi:hypothetical protein